MTIEPRTIDSHSFMLGCQREFHQSAKLTNSCPLLPSKIDLSTQFLGWVLGILVIKYFLSHTSACDRDSSRDLRDGLVN